MRLKKSAIPLSICVGIYYLSILAFLILNRPSTAAPLSEAVVFYPIGVLGLPIVGILLMFWGYTRPHRGRLLSYELDARLQATLHDIDSIVQGSFWRYRDTY